MKYNPQIHHRRSIRLKGYDYSQAGAYFITIDCKDLICRFGKIENNEMVLNEFGLLAYNEWAALPERYENVELDVFQIMPNHMHGIIVLKPVGATLAVAHPNTTGKALVGAGFTPAQNTPAQNTPMQIEQLGTERHESGDDDWATARVAPTTTAAIGDIVGAYKSLVINLCIDICNLQHIRLGKFWQRNYYEHIIRHEQSYKNISNYIINNPATWKDDKFYRL